MGKLGLIKMVFGSCESCDCAQKWFSMIKDTVKFERSLNNLFNNFKKFYLQLAKQNFLKFQSCESRREE